MTDPSWPADEATPVAALKLVRLRVHDGLVRLAPAYERWGAPAVYAADADAACDVDPGHVPPVSGCRCGFHAVADEQELVRLGRPTRRRFVADVELTGVVIEHEHGWRASHQQVTAVRLPDRCARCGRRADGVAADRAGAVFPSCGRHGRRFHTADEAAAQVGAPLVWVPDTGGRSERREAAVFAAVWTLVALLMMAGLAAGVGTLPWIVYATASHVLWLTLAVLTARAVRH